MADPFEVRMRFSNMLNTLSASLNSAHKAAVYALKHREMDEDLQSCIVEQLEKKHNMNNKANIMYFYEALCDLASKEHHLEYVRMMERDIMRIVDLVAPKDGTGAANVKVVRKVLRNLAAKRYLQEQTVEELDEYITDRHQMDGQPGIASPEQTRHYSNENIRFDKREAAERVEEDRERHKRLREGAWKTETDLDEFEQMWRDTPDLNDDDFIMAREQAEERQHCARLHQIEYSAV